MLILTFEDGKYKTYSPESRTSGYVEVTQLDRERLYISYDIAYPGLKIRQLRTAAKILHPKFPCSFDALCKVYLHKAVDKLRFNNTTKDTDYHYDQRTRATIHMHV